MMKLLRKIFKSKKSMETEKYKSASDFFMRASAEEQKKIFIEAARRANEDQMEVFKRAQNVEV